MLTGTKPAKTTPDAAPTAGTVPPELADAYAAATSDIHAYTERAASQLAFEWRSRQNPDARGAIMHSHATATPERQAAVQAALAATQHA